MSQELPAQIPVIADYNRADYSSYKASVDRAEAQQAWLEDKSFKGVMKRAITKTIDFALIPYGGTNTRERSAEIFAEPRRHLAYSAEYLEENEEAVRLDAIHDFYNDPDNAGRKLNVIETDPAPVNLPLPKGFNSLDEMQEHVDWVKGASTGIENIGRGLIANSPFIAYLNRERSPVKPIVAGVAAMTMGVIGKEAARRMQADVTLYAYSADAGIIAPVPNP